MCSSDLVCAYAAAEQRWVWTQRESVDFLENRQPIIQRFLRGFEAAIQGAEFPFGIEFAMRVAEDLAQVARATKNGVSPAVTC